MPLPAPQQAAYPGLHGHSVSLCTAGKACDVYVCCCEVRLRSWRADDCSADSKKQSQQRGWEEGYPAAIGCRRGAARAPRPTARQQGRRPDTPPTAAAHPPPPPCPAIWAAPPPPPAALRMCTPQMFRCYRHRSDTDKLPWNDMAWPNTSSWPRSMTTREDIQHLQRLAFQDVHLHTQGSNCETLSVRSGVLGPTDLAQTVVARWRRNQTRQQAVS